MPLLRTGRRGPRTALSTGVVVLLTALAVWALPAAPAAAQAQRVESWGHNGYGQLGDGTTHERHTPVTVAGLTAAGVTHLASGGGHGLAALANGTVKAWGANDYGQVGDGTTSDLSDPDHLTPGTVRDLSGVTAVAAGCLHSVALLANGTVRAWGNNYSGQLDGTTGGLSTTPVTVVDPGNPGAPLRRVIAIAAGCDHTLALLSDGTVRAWGDNSSGQLGTGTIGGSTGTPVAVVGLTGVRDIDAGLAHSLALRGTGTVRAWGDNSDGQLGNGSIGGETGTPGLVVGLTGVRDVDAGYSHSLALRTDGTVRAWGDNSDGQLGNGSVGGASGTPAPVVGLTGVRQIAAGDLHNLARLSDGTLRAWGHNSDGRLGDGSTTDSGTPVLVRTGIAGVTRLAAGGFSLAA
ncbi:RCC1 domain-containing protein [Streptomyces sp. NPDC001595]|uniref:RCC1 domain-containing protein n=1 Tax=Streptomyces sp. NPDC001532 TaxID=3154520 RepID=UPI00331DD3FD